jgi:hypothetical protein
LLGAVFIRPVPSAPTAMSGHPQGAWHTARSSRLRASSARSGSCRARKSSATIRRTFPIGLRPRIQISAAIDDLTAKAVEGWPGVLVPPLCEFLAGTDDIQSARASVQSAFIPHRCPVAIRVWQAVEAADRGEPTEILMVDRPDHIAVHEAVSSLIEALQALAPTHRDRRSLTCRGRSVDFGGWRRVRFPLGCM